MMCALLAALPQMAGVYAAQIDISGPAGSVAFGTMVKALPNGNIVVTDPQFANGATTNVGAVYLYTPDLVLISSLTGSTANDNVGDGGVVIVGGSNFVVVSSSWNNSGVSSAGAVTWVNGNTGLSGVVSPSNSLVGTTAGDMLGVGLAGLNNVIVLSNGNYVVGSPNWNSGVIAAHVGAATWANGSTGITGNIAAANSLVGTTVNDGVGLRVTALSNGNYVVASPSWNNGVKDGVFGAVTWGDGSSGVSGLVSASNSLLGTTMNDCVGGDCVGTIQDFVVALKNGNYVVRSPKWNNQCGAATWGNGGSGVTGPVSASNSLVGTAYYDRVSSGGVTALSNGNYVVVSSSWNNGVMNGFFGAVTWGDGGGGTAGAVSVGNSLYGTTTQDFVGNGSVVALSNSNYVVASPFWNGGTPNSRFGAATWGNGSSGSTGAVSASNSLVGTTANDEVGGVTALSDGNYIVLSQAWNNGAPNSLFGAATWGDGTSGISGAVSASNSLIGTFPYDFVGSGAAALSNGNYVVASRGWNSVGAATWGGGGSGIIGQISASNSLVGTNVNDGTSLAVYALSNGNYVVNSGFGGLGAVTWGIGSSGITGPVSSSNSLIGNTGGDNIGSSGIVAMSDGTYVVASPLWNGNFGAVTLASGAFRLKGTIEAWNSVMGTAANGGPFLRYDYNPTRHELTVGRRVENIVSVFTMDQIFASDFDP